MRRVSTLQRALRCSPNAPTEGVAWVSPVRFRIGVRLLGWVDAGLAYAFGDALRASMKNATKFRVILIGPAAFPDRSRTRLLLAHASETVGPLRDVVEEVDRIADRLGLAPNPRPFVPHIVLARTREPIDTTEWLASSARSESIESVATEIVLYDASVFRVSNSAVAGGGDFVSVDAEGCSRDGVSSLDTGSIESSVDKSLGVSESISGGVSHVRCIEARSRSLDEGSVDGCSESCVDGDDDGGVWKKPGGSAVGTNGCCVDSGPPVEYPALVRIPLFGVPSRQQRHRRS